MTYIGYRERCAGVAARRRWDRELVPAKFYGRSRKWGETVQVVAGSKIGLQFGRRARTTMAAESVAIARTVSPGVSLVGTPQGASATPSTIPSERRGKAERTQGP